MESVKGKVVLITGASSGIGAGTAELFAKYGAKLVIGGRNETKLQATATACQQAGLQPQDILCVIGDITNGDDCNAIVDKAVEKFGQLDVVINNAGTVLIGDLEKLTVENLDFMYKTLLRAPFTICKRAVPHLKKSKGAIVNVSSIAANIYQTGYMSYGMMKTAVNHFTKTLAQELGPHGVRVNCIMPGAIDTGLFEASAAISGQELGDKEQLMKSVAASHALRRIGTVAEVAQLIVFLSSNAASFMTGSDILVDGGISTKSPV